MEAHGSFIQQNDIRRFDDDQTEWIYLARVATVCRKRNQSSSQASFIKTFNLEHRVLMRRGDNVGERVEIALVKNGFENPEFKPSTMEAFVKLNDVLQIPEIGSRMMKLLSVYYQHKIDSSNFEAPTESTNTGKSVSTRSFYENQLPRVDSVVNFELCGLYLVEFGQVSDLVESMPLNQAKYPSRTYGEYRVGKLGYTGDFRQRFPELRHDYRKFTSSFKFRWLCLIPHGKLFQAEVRLKQLVCENHMKLQFNGYRELVIYNSDSEKVLNDIYKLVEDEFSTVEHDSKVREIAISSEADLDRLKCEHMAQMMELKSKQADDMKTIYELRMQLLQKDMELQALRNSR